MIFCNPENRVVHSLEGVNANTGVHALVDVNISTGVQALEGVNENTVVRALEGVIANTAVQALEGMNVNTGVQTLEGVNVNTVMQALEGVNGRPPPPCLLPGLRKAAFAILYLGLYVVFAPSLPLDLIFAPDFYTQPLYRKCATSC